MLEARKSRKCFVNMRSLVLDAEATAGVALTSDGARTYAGAFSLLAIESPQVTTCWQSLGTSLQRSDSANVLQWWTRSDDQRRLPNWQRFPTISKIARRVLCIPATSAPRHAMSLPILFTVFQ